MLSLRLRILFDRQKSGLWSRLQKCTLFPGITLFFLIVGFSSSISGEPLRGPWGKRGSETTSHRQARSEVNPLRSLVQVHRNYISPIDGKTCPMHPSCSGYSLLCFEEHGSFIGWVMTCDRLIHEADEMRKAPVIYTNGVERFYDPLRNNDFWWHGER
ncbi:MAG TPA: membrane protein insertion efficiency factor YidD [Desulfobacterales bacterium]|nr:membrane protein insertion efficiency factor YidD [Desulfobacterales bacterium]